MLYNFNWKEVASTQWLQTITFILQGAMIMHKGGFSALSYNSFVFTLVTGRYTSDWQVQG
jgi:hypothetical protein